MNSWFLIGLLVLLPAASSIITYLATTVRAQRLAEERTRTLAEAQSALEAERAKFEQAAKGIEENADLCAWNFGKPYVTDVKGEQVIYNAVVGGVPVLVQMGWDLTTQKCVQGVINP